MTRPYTKIFFDGGCRPNPGTMEIAVVARGAVLIERDLGYGSSLDAEWLALLRAIAVMRTLGVRDAVLLGDSMPVVLKANAALAGAGGTGHAATLIAAVSGLGALRIRHVGRAQNLAGIALARTPR